MKRFFITAIMLVLTSNIGYTQHRFQKTYISVNIPELLDSTGIAEYGIEKPLDLEFPYERNNVELKRGRLEIELNLKEPSNVGIVVKGRLLGYIPMNTFLIEPGDSIIIDVPDFKKTELSALHFSGRGSEKFEFLKRIWAPYIKYSRSQKRVWPIEIIGHHRSHAERYRILDSAIRVNQSMVKKNIFEIIKAQTLSRSFIPLMELTADLMEGDSVRTAYIKNIASHQLNEEFTKPGVYLHLPMLHKEFNYLALLDYGMKNKIAVGHLQGSNLLLYYSIISDYYRDFPEIKNYLLAEWIIRYIRTNGISKEVDSTVKKFITNVPSGILHDQVVKRYDVTKKNNSKGVPFFNFALENDRGEIVKLSDFKGKAVFIDFYFTGCGPCRLLVPTIQAMEEKYKKNNIVFISINIDRDKAEWKSGRGKFSSPSSVQLYTNGLGNKHPLILHAGISSYPTMFLIDEDGKIFDSNFSYKPEEIQKRIEQVLKMQ